MDAVAGVFLSSAAATKAIGMLTPMIARERINVLLPSESRTGGHGEAQDVPTTDDMAPVGRGMIAALGGALGLGLGAVILLPAVGAVTVLGVVGTALAGVGGAVIGGEIGKAADEALSGGLPVDELYVYEDAIRRGRTVVLVLVDRGEQATLVREVMSQAGAESVDAARELWWTGLRDAERASYTSAEAGDFGKDEPFYRKGFEAALRPDLRGRAFVDVADDLRGRFPQMEGSPAFARGYESGLAHYKGLLAKQAAA